MKTLYLSRALLTSAFLMGACTASELSYFKEGERLGSHFVDAMIYNIKTPEDSVIVPTLLKEFFVHEPKSTEFQEAFSHLKSVLSGFKQEVIRRTEPLAVTEEHQIMLKRFITWLDTFIDSKNMAILIGHIGRCVSELDKLDAANIMYGHFRLPYLILPNIQSRDYIFGENMGKLAHKALILVMQDAPKEQFTEILAEKNRLLNAHNRKNKGQLGIIISAKTDFMRVIINMLVGFEKGFQEISPSEMSTNTHLFKAHMVRLASHIPLRCIREFFDQQPLYAVIDGIGQEITYCGKQLETLF